MRQIVDGKGEYPGLVFFSCNRCGNLCEADPGTTELPDGWKVIKKGGDFRPAEHACESCAKIVY